MLVYICFLPSSQFTMFHSAGLQARTGRVWQCLSPEGFALNSKWNEAEKYICNPLSGEFPMECLSAKTLSGRCNLTSRITMSAPLTYPSSHHSTRQSQTEPSSQPLTVPGKKPGIVMTRDVGIQSSPMELSSGSMSPTSTLSVAESVQFKKLGTEAMKSNKEVDSKEATGGAAGGDGEVRRLNNDEDKKEKQEKRRTRCRWGHSRSGCLWWIKKMQRDEKNKPSKCNNSVS
ncbi:hypothetical protein SAY86_020441 [Trapa natans]|uniref:Uncharacterized protein n=1 Tax=Trapa natans TaxID=22666 RepID=A0AAN7R474_TRANT|nr:hypothetical protein SAY86_020441 [Trapa natans]